MGGPLETRLGMVFLVILLLPSLADALGNRRNREGRRRRNRAPMHLDARVPAFHANGATVMTEPMMRPFSSGANSFQLILPVVGVARVDTHVHNIRPIDTPLDAFRRATITTLRAPIFAEMLKQGSPVASPLALFRDMLTGGFKPIAYFDAPPLVSGNRSLVLFHDSQGKLFSAEATLEDMIED